MIDDAIKGFMEVKPTLRGDDDVIKFQIIAEMAAFIYTEGPKITSKKRQASFRFTENAMWTDII